MPSEQRIFLLTVDVVRHPHLRRGVEQAIGLTLPEFGRLHSNGFHIMRQSKTDWMLVVPQFGAAFPLDALRKHLSGSAAIISEATDGYIIVSDVDSEKLTAHSGVALREGEANVMNIRQVDVVAYMADARITLVIPRSFRNVPGW